MNVWDVLGTQIHYVDRYEPYHGGRNPRFRESAISSRILNLKSENIESVDCQVPFFSDLLRPFIATLPADFILCHVPSHEAWKPSRGLAKILENVARPGDEVAVDLIMRTKSITKLATGGSRALPVHFGSLSISASKARGRRVLVLDDVTKTGKSLVASGRMLKGAGAIDICLVALGKR